MKPRAAEQTQPEPPPPFQRRVVIGRRQAVALGLLFLVPALALARLLGDRVERIESRTGGWRLSADVPACARDGDPLRITVNLARAHNRAASPMAGVDISTDYLECFAEVRRRPSVFKSAGDDVTEAAAPVIIELTPDRFGWARGRLAVTTETGERLELALNTFIFP